MGRLLQVVPEALLRFFHDDPVGRVRLWKCGVPMSHALSNMFREVILFHLDRAICHATEGVVHPFA